MKLQTTSETKSDPTNADFSFLPYSFRSTSQRFCWCIVDESWHQSCIYIFNSL